MTALTSKAEVEVINPKVIEVATRINKNMDKVASYIFQIGDDLLKAKKDFKHGEMDVLYAQLSFDKRTAQKYMAIAKSKRLSNSIEPKELPNSVSSLYAIAKMKQDDYDAAIDAEIINSTTTANDILIFKKRNEPTPVEYKEKRRAITIYIDSEDTGLFDDLDAIKDMLAEYEGFRIEDHDAAGKFEREQERIMNKDLNDEKKEAKNISNELLKKERQKAKSKGMKFDEYILKEKGRSKDDWSSYNPRQIVEWLDCPDALNHLTLAMNFYDGLDNVLADY